MINDALLLAGIVTLVARHGKVVQHKAYGMQDVALQHARIAESGAGEGQKILESQRLTALLAYCEVAECRRQVLLRYFGE